MTGLAALTGANTSAISPVASEQRVPAPPTSEELDKVFLVGPSAITALGLTTVWQSQVKVGERESARKIFATDGDSVFIYDSGCHISRMLASNGRVIWKNACGKSTDSVLGVNRVLAGTTDQVLVCLDNAILTLDGSNGKFAKAHKLTRYPDTSGVIYDNYLIFGAKGGQVAWQQFHIGYFWFANELGGVIHQPPILIGSNIVAASSSGQVAMLSATSTRQVWRKTLGGSVTGILGLGADAIYAAAADQSLSALEVGNGKLRWRYQSASPLTGDVFCDGESVFVQVVGEGLIALEAKPLANDATFSRDGIVRWKSAATGNPICAIGSTILLWNSAAKKLTSVDASTGSVVASLTLAKVNHLIVTGPINPDLYLLGADGLVQRCESTASAAAAKSAIAAAATGKPPAAGKTDTPVEFSGEEPTVP